MSGKIRIGGLVFAAAVIVLFAGQCFGQANQDPCGGHYAGEGLKAMFIDSHDDFPYYIVNDIPYYYQYYVPGGDCIFRYRRGHIIFDINLPDPPPSTRVVYVHMERPAGYPGGYPTPPFMSDSITYTIQGIPFEKAKALQLKMINEFVVTQGDAEHSDHPVLTQAGYLQFQDMTPGQTKYCDIGGTFFPEGDSNHYNFSSQVQVLYDYVGIGGGLGWQITPIDGSYYVLSYEATKVGKKTILVPKYTENEFPSRQQINSWTGADYGEFELPFKLIIERLQ